MSESCLHEYLHTAERVSARRSGGAGSVVVQECGDLFRDCRGLVEHGEHVGVVDFYEPETTPSAPARRKERRAIVTNTLDDRIGNMLSDSERQRLVALMQRVADTVELSPGIHPHLRSNHG